MMKEIKERLNKWRDILCSQTGRFNIMKIIFPKPFYSQEAQSKSQQDFLDINQQADSNIDVFYLTFLCLKIAMNADYFGHVLILLLECKQDKKITDAQNNHKYMHINIHHASKKDFSKEKK